MVLTDAQTDAIKELINIAFGRTAAALSQLTNYHVILEPPEAGVYPIKELSTRLAEFVDVEVASVHQLFSGAVSGDAMLILNCADATTLTDLLTDQPVRSPRLDLSSREVLTEVGNILLNACLGMFGNLLHVHISFSVPRLRLDSLESLLRSIVIGDQELRYALLTYTQFHLRDSSVSGCLVIVLGVTSLERLVTAINEWVERAVPSPRVLPRQ